MLDYRKDIDGLRGLSVISVLLYHADFSFKFYDLNFQIFSGGFLGVDIFFVISGFLISKILIEQLDQKKLSYKNFYERRLRRIIPALFFVIILCFPLGWIYMSPEQLSDFSFSTLYMIFFQSNLWFYFKGSYLEFESSLRPILHTWSLSVEEQFYIFFPFLLVLLYQKKKIINYLFFLITISFIFSVFLSYRSPEFTFYFIFSRVWELGLGSLTYIFYKNQKLDLKNNNQYLVLTAFFLLIYSIIFFDDQIKHPSLLTLIPVISTCCLIKYYDNSLLVYKFLQNRLLIYTGLISYSLYLWHFPLLSFYKIKSFTISNVDKIEVLIVCLILSIITYYLIEKPFRNFNSIKTKNFFISFFLSFSFILILSVSTIINKGFSDRFSDELNRIMNYSYTNYSDDYLEGKCMIGISESNKKNPFDNCIDEIDNSKKNIFLWGDSLAAHLIPGLKYNYQKEYNLIFRTVGACPPYLISGEKKCDLIHNQIFKEIQDLNIDTLILSGSWGQNIASLNTDKKMLLDLLQKTNKLNVKRIIIIGPYLKWNKPIKTLLIKQYYKSRNIPERLTISHQIETFRFEKDLRTMTNKFNIHYISFLDIFCNDKDNRCNYLIQNDNGSTLSHWDENHLTKDASIYFTKIFKYYLEK